MTFDEYFNEEEIINYLSRQRAKLARKRSKEHIMVGISQKSKKKLIIKQDKKNDLFNIMPPRRLWVRISKEKRYRNDCLINSIERNCKVIYSTIKKHRKDSIKYSYMEKLELFISNIYKSINNKHFRFLSPNIKPVLKKKGKCICRPIASYKLKDNLINCLTNKYLVNYLDDLFYEHSYAFRAKRFVNDKKKALNHHDAFKVIIEYLKNNTGKKIFVAECDMQKFYDTVNHKIVMKQFRKLCFRKIFKERCDKRAKKIFKAYLNCYNFNENVYKLNDDKKHFEKLHIDNAKYDWINENNLKELYKKSEDYKFVGIPQGGALSGLIANIVLNYADEKVLKLKDENLLYVRYCDDMIIMHTDRKKCENALEAYQKSLKKLKLFPHLPENIKYGKIFWDVKSKETYEWSYDNIPWVGFVGYEINRNGDVRVRKSSLKKEMNKQFELIENIRSAISNKVNVSKGTIIESAYSRLNGMAVGRVALCNFPDYENDMCWVKGFQLLNKNKYSSLQ